MIIYAVLLTERLRIFTESFVLKYDKTVNNYYTEYTDPVSGKPTNKIKLPLDIDITNITYMNHLGDDKNIYNNIKS